MRRVFGGIMKDRLWLGCHVGVLVRLRAQQVSVLEAVKQTDTCSCFFTFNNLLITFNIRLYCKAQQAGCV